MKIQAWFTNRWTALEWSAIQSRHDDLVVLTKEEHSYRIYSTRKIHPADIEELNKLDAILVIAQGKISRHNLQVGETSYVQEELNRIEREK